MHHIIHSVVTVLIDPARHEVHTAMLHRRDATAPGWCVRCSLTRTAFQFTQPNSARGKACFISHERVSACSMGVEEGPGEGGRTSSSINAASASFYPTHLQIPEPLCEEKGNFPTERHHYFRAKSLEASRGGGSGGAMIRLPGAGEGQG